MSKNKNNLQEAEVVREIANPQGKTVEEMVTIAQNLQAQLNQEQALQNQDQERVRTRQAKILRIHGGLEAVLQMIPKERVEKMMEEESKSLQQNGQKIN